MPGFFLPSTWSVKYCSGLAKSRGVTSTQCFLLVEQNFRFASKIADRFYLMDHGQMVADFPVAELPDQMPMLHKVLGV